MLKEPLTSTMEEPMSGPRVSGSQLDILDSYPSTTSTDINNIPYEILVFSMMPKIYHRLQMELFKCPDVMTVLQI